MDKTNKTESNQEEINRKHQEEVNKKLQLQAIKEFLNSEAGSLLIKDLEGFADPRKQLYAAVDDIYFSVDANGKTDEQLTQEIASRLLGDLKQLQGIHAALTRIKSLGNIGIEPYQK